MKKISRQNGQNLSVSDLIVFSVYSVSLKKETCGFERLVKECFKLFPSTFSFSEYPRWPDSRKLDRPLRELKKRNLIGGDPAISFFLTKAGQKTAEGISKVFRQRKLFK